MCLILWSYDEHPRYRLILAANRDELHARPSRPADYWSDRPGVLGGRDLAGGGTWLALHRSGRLAAVTNFRNPAAHDPQARSRGDLVVDFVAGDQTPEAYLEAVAARRGEYNGFNLMVAADGWMGYFGSEQGRIRRLEPGTYGLSNHLLDTPWPKVTEGKAALAREAARDSLAPEDLLAVLLDRRCPPDGRLPDTGVGLEWERLLAPRFIVGREYGTRTSMVLLVTREGRVTFKEWTFVPGTEPPAVCERRAFRFSAPALGDGAGRRSEPVSEDANRISGGNRRP